MDMAMAVSLSVHVLSQYPVVTWGTRRAAGALVAGHARGLGARGVRADGAARGLGCGGHPSPERERSAGRVVLCPDRRQRLDYRTRPRRSVTSSSQSRIRGRRAWPVVRSWSSRGCLGSRSARTRRRWGSVPVPAAELVFSACPRPGRESPGRGGRRLPDRAVRAGRGAGLDRGGVRGAGTGGRRAGRRVPAGTDGVRGAARGPAGAAVHARGAVAGCRVGDCWCGPRRRRRIAVSRWARRHRSRNGRRATSRCA